MSSKKSNTLPCPCGGPSFQLCCQPYIQANAPAPNAEALMRSRYTAYTLSDENYVLSTWHVSTRPPSLDLYGQDAVKWLGLSIKNHIQNDKESTVEFIARYKPAGGGPAQRLHEKSRFLFEKNQWFYVDGDLF